MRLADMLLLPKCSRFCNLPFVQICISAANGFHDLAKSAVITFDPPMIHDLVEGHNRTVSVSMGIPHVAYDTLTSDGTYRLSVGSFHPDIAASPSYSDVTKSSFVYNNDSQFYTIDTAVIVQGNSLGKTGLRLRLVRAENWTDMDESWKLDMSAVYETIRRPVAPAIGFAAQFVIMPLLAYGIAKTIMRPFIIFVLIFVVVFGAITNLYMFRMMTVPALLGGLLLPWCGFMFGCFVSIITRRSPPDVTAIAIETGIQNTGIAILVLKVITAVLMSSYMWQHVVILLDSERADCWGKLL
ncbi:hypothetical protein TELCIR_08738 [Teladorsagia circumcincta]|uniref:Uncharacterized protein n=1 Tax=Teladorsagia circumcincta TaxID=45464 RepID=A0A2G9UGY0_TELCI|nr:hypothetical protein TELCIR_08738 [Teladorsagia circumcincta]